MPRRTVIRSASSGKCFTTSCASASQSVLMTMRETWLLRKSAESVQQYSGRPASKRQFLPGTRSLCSCAHRTQASAVQQTKSAGAVAAARRRKQGFVAWRQQLLAARAVPLASGTHRTFIGISATIFGAMALGA